MIHMEEITFDFFELCMQQTENNKYYGTNLSHEKFTENCISSSI